MKLKDHWQITLRAGLTYALAIGLMTLPAPFQLSHRLLGHGIDTWIFYWNNWWLERAIVEGRNWLSTPYLFYPQGASLVAHSNSFLNSLLALPLKPLLGPVAAYNLVILFGLWVSAIGMFLLVHEITRRSSPALLGGFIFAFAPYHLTQALAHVHLGSIQWWPFYVLYLRRVLRGYRLIDALMAGCFATLTVWSGFQLALLLALWTVAYVGWYLLREAGARDMSRQPWPRIVGIVTIVGILTLTLSAPVILPAAQEWHQLADAAASFDEGMIRQTDLLAYLLPPSYHPLVGSYVLPAYEKFKNNRLYMPYLGYTVLGLALASLLSRRKEARFWLLSAGFWMMLAAGSAPRLNGTVYSHILLPYRLIGRLFPFSTIRAPDRFNLLVVLSLTISASLGAAHLARHRRWMLVPLVLLVLIEYLSLPIPMLDFPPGSRFFDQMAQDESTYGVVDYPMGYSSGKKWLYYQTLHKKPIVEGHVSRYTLEDYSFIASQPLLRTLYQVADVPVRVPGDVFSGEPISGSNLYPALRSLETSGVRYILLHKSHVNTAVEAYFRRVLPIVPTYEDEVLAVYDTARPFPVYYDGFPIALAPDVALARFDVHHDDGHAEWQFQVLVVQLASREFPLTCQIQLTGRSGGVLALPITVFDVLPEADRPGKSGDLELIEAATSLPKKLEPGVYNWAVTCPGPTVYTAPETLEVHPDGHTTYLRRRLHLRYGDVIQLLGYRWRTVGAELAVTLQWQALGNPHADYKVFVHLLNGEEEIVEQYDAMPCSWQCPTSEWRAGEIIPDQAIIDLGGLPPGEYRLAVGLYIEETMERLPVYGSEGEIYPSAFSILPDAFVISEINLPVGSSFVR